MTTKTKERYCLVHDFDETYFLVPSAKVKQFLKIVRTDAYDRGDVVLPEYARSVEPHWLTFENVVVRRRS